uniref:Si:ch211-255p10.3 n=1 Tax=Pygocentrus nattereri TaxID=42514 RepID=A0AAR2L7R0_PYGNA
MPESADVPAQCQVLKEEVDKCVQAKGPEGCKELLEAFEACMKSVAAAS